MSKYFKEFPTISYNNILSKNITLRTKILDKIKNNSTLFYSYTLEDGQTAESIAYDYYGDSNYVWLMYLTNNIIDPYYDWHLSSVDFERYIINKYGSLSAAQQEILYYKKIPVDYYINNLTNDFVLASSYNPTINGYGWTKITIDDDIKVNNYAYRINTENNIILNTENGSRIVTEFSPALDPAIWTPVDVYTYELEQNEEKRYIKLLDLKILSSIDTQFKELMNV